VRTLDRGVREVVTLLNEIAGVRTRASCEGRSLAPSTHRHADLAYVLLEHPLPLVLEDFLLDTLGALARVDHDGVYSRWPASNHEFLERFADAARAYRAREGALRAHLRVQLATLRARLARRVAQRLPASISLCTACRVIDIEAHDDSHAAVRLLTLRDDQASRWFAQFVVQLGNSLDPQLIEKEGWESIISRTQRGDFGLSFRRRWLRFRSKRLVELTTDEMRSAVETARREGCRFDFYFDDNQAVFRWEPMRLWRTNSVAQT